MPETMPVGEVCSEQIQTQRPRLPDVLRDRARRTGHPEATITSFARWVTSLVRFHNWRHPRELHASDVSRFLEHVSRARGTRTAW